MTNAELIKALRYCKDCEVCNKDASAECPYEHHWLDGEDCQCMLLADAADALEAAEKRIAELMPKDGEWIYTPLERYKEYKVKCPFCGAEYHDCYDGYIDAEDMNYCPNCGARMRGANDGC